MSSTQDPGHVNRLSRATSPYLIQHKHNPVDWWPWGPEALAEAKRSNKPILLSVGYAACHWCHVMAHESFEDPATARVMNELFINIKVDREERPDIDQIYMNALHLLGEQGGWPLTMFLTPNAEPVWGGTYFPKESRFGRPAFVDVLREVARLFREEPNRIEQNRAALLSRLSEKARPAGKVTIGLKELDSAAMQIGNMFDRINGGLRGAPKFPQPSILEMLWRAGQRTGDARFFETVEFTLARMSEGGIYDHLGGGFSRYSVDEKWLVPHFEKMLYDNAQLLELLALAWGRSRQSLFAQRARETVAWLNREMTTREGAFAASLDADSEGEEGKFYVWSYDEVIQALGVEDGEFFARHYDVTPSGNFEGHNILNRLSQKAFTSDDADRLALLRSKLLAVRDMRVRPGLDDKILADWNGLMIAALVNAGIILEEPDWLAAATRAFNFIVETMSRGDRLGHSWREGMLQSPGLASDYANMIRAALALHEATGKRVYLEHALRWQNALDSHYADAETGRYYLSADDAQDLLLRPHSTQDDATPNPNAVTAQNLIRFAVLAGEGAWRDKADRLLESVLSIAGSNLFGHVALLNALDLRLRTAEIIVTGPDAAEFARSALKIPFTDRILVRADSPDELPTSHPAREKMTARPARSAAFICVGERCSLPITEPDAIFARVAEMRSPSSIT
ncbi:MAG TPA: thioredoxin domain-containing protein [Pseudolabrys sp.]|nr:thioredoxin domain-containing protein [Pseudolabrys sp.]